MKFVILGSGGDAPGMNMCVHELVKLLTIFHKNEVYASMYGFRGLIENNFKKITTKDTRKYKNQAGIFIKSSRCEEMKTEEGLNKAVQNLNNAKIDVLIILGGNGSYRGAVALMKKSVKVIFIPATIDRDMQYDTYSIGFFTAVSACCHYIHDVKPTMDAFDRVCVYEIMGNENSSLTKLVGDIVDADLIITKENINKIDYQKFGELVKQNPTRTVVLQENLTPINEIVEKIASVISSQVRSCVIGYIQRGTSPTMEEKRLSRKFAHLVVKAIRQKKFESAICIDEIGGKILKLS